MIERSLDPAALPRRQKRLTKIACITMAAGAVVVVGCSEHTPTLPAARQLSTQVVVSAPVGRSGIVARVSRGVARTEATAVTNDDSVVYVSMPPRSVTNGENATVRNLATGQVVTVAMANGGFDPVPVAAAVGDSVEVEVRGHGAVIEADFATVPPHRPPSLVRTDPPKGKTDVPLNTQIVIVFSEPVAPATVASAVHLLNGPTLVPGTVALSASGIVAFFTPDSALAARTLYELVVDTTLRNSRGEALASPADVTFTTGTAGSAAFFVVTGLPCNIVVTAEDSVGNIATSYSGTVHFTSTDADATLPPDYTFVSGDKGTHSFPITLKTSGSQLVSASDVYKALIGSEAVEVDLTVLDKPLYVSNDNSRSITVYTARASCNTEPSYTIAGSNTGLDAPAFALGVAVDGSGQVYVASQTAQGPGLINIYATGAVGNVAPAASITNSSGLLYPSGILLDKAGRLYVASGNVLVYAAGAAGNASPIDAFSGYPGLFGIALDASGNIYYSSWVENTILVSPTGAIRGPRPALIAGSNTGLNGPTGLAVDNAGRLYVANAFSASINIYAAGATGDVAPVATIAGNRTGLSGPEAIAFDGAGRLYVANRGNSSITVYAPGATGNATPIAMIVGDKTGLNEPSFIAFPVATGTP